jgi:hypothetical protein
MPKAERLPRFGLAFQSPMPALAETGLVEARLIKPEDDRLCSECIKLDATMLSPINFTEDQQHAVTPETSV